MSENLSTETCPCKNGDGEKILVVDDEETVLEIIKEALETWKYEIETFSNPIKALKFFRKNPDIFDLVITNWVMPKMNGRELIQEIRKVQNGTRLKIIVISGYPKNEKGFTETKIDGFLEKPFKLEKLGTKVREVLDAVAI